jgi:hypothetical protein
MWSVVLKITEGARKQKEKGGRIVKERIHVWHISQGSRSRAEKCMETYESMHLVLRRLSPKQCVNQSSRGSCPPVSGGVIRRGNVQRPPEALRRSRIFFRRLLRIDQFSYRI